MLNILPFLCQIGYLGAIGGAYFIQKQFFVLVYLCGYFLAESS